MNHEKYDKFLAVEGGGHGIDQKRHVVRDHLDHRMVAVPTVDFRSRVGDANLRTPRIARRRESEMRDRRAGEVRRVVFSHVARRDVHEIPANEILLRFRAPLPSPRPRPAHDRLDGVGGPSPRIQRHGHPLERIAFDRNSDAVPIKRADPLDLDSVDQIHAPAGSPQAIPTNRDLV